MLKKTKFYLAAPFFNPAQLAVVQGIEEAFDGAGIDFFSPRLLPQNAEGPINPQKAQEIFREDVKQLVICDAMIAVVDWRMPEGQQLRVVDMTSQPESASEIGYVREDEFTRNSRPDTPSVLGVPFKSPPLNLPDSGTVFEMGFAYARTKLAFEYFESRAFDPVEVLRKAQAYVSSPSLRTEVQDVADMLSRLSAVLRPMKTVVYTDRPPTTGLNLMLTQGAAGVVSGIPALRDFLGKSGEPNWESLKPWTGKNR